MPIVTAGYGMRDFRSAQRLAARHAQSAENGIFERNTVVGRGGIRIDDMHERANAALWRVPQALSGIIAP